MSESRVGCQEGVSGVVKYGLSATMVTFTLDACSSASEQFVAICFAFGVLFSLRFLL